MRATRILQMLLLLQNRGRLTCAQLAHELEVTRRTVLRDVDALTLAGLPIVVLHGRGGGVELGFNYRTRLTGLDEEEAEAIAVLLSQPTLALKALGMDAAAKRAKAKLFESFPDVVRRSVDLARQRFRFADPAVQDNDPRILAFVEAIRSRSLVRVHANTKRERVIHPIGITLTTDGWVIHDSRKGEPDTSLQSAGDINVSAKQF